MMDANGSHLKPLAAARLMFTPSRELIFTGVTNAEDFRIRNAHTIKTVVCADTRGLRMMDANGSHLKPLAAAGLINTPSRDLSFTGVTSADTTLIKTVER